MPEPPLTPIEADAAIRASRRDPLVVCGWSFHMDGPAMSPWEYMYPVAVPPGCESTDESWLYPTGEPGDMITQFTAWVQP